MVVSERESLSIVKVKGRKIAVIDSYCTNGRVYEKSLQYVIMDACDASYNAVEKVFPRAKILMCWFHVQFNIRKKCEAKLGDDLWQVLLKDMRGLHYSISTEEYREKTRTSKHYWVKTNKDVYTYCES